MQRPHDGNTGSEESARGRQSEMVLNRMEMSNIRTKRSSHLQEMPANRVRVQAPSSQARIQERTRLSSEIDLLGPELAPLCKLAVGMSERKHPDFVPCGSQTPGAVEHLECVSSARVGIAVGEQNSHVPYGST